MSTELPFKFRFVKAGKAQSIRAKKGVATQASLQLIDEELPLEAIADTTTRDKRVIIQLAHGTTLGEQTRSNIAGPNLLILEIAGDALAFEKFVDRHGSAAVAKKHQNELIQAGRAGEFRSVVCSHCQSTINLTGLNRSRYTFCRYCESVLNGQGEVVTNGDHYNNCDECQMFDRTQGFTEFYFYFLLIVYGFRSNRRFMCDDCALKMTRKMFFINLIFILGLFPTLFNRIKIGRGKLPELKQLAKANGLAKNAKPEEAGRIYDDLHGSLEDHPGLYYNQTLSALIGGNSGDAEKYIKESLNTCSNYLPTLQLLNRLRQASSS